MKRVERFRDCASQIMIQVVLIIVLVAPTLATESAGDSARLKAPEIFEHTLDFMVTLDLAVFAVVGFFSKDGISSSKYLRRIQIGSFGLFIVFGALSLLFAYDARIEIMRQLAGGAFSYETLNYYVWQGWTLLIAAICAGVFVIIALWTKSPETR